MLFLPDFPHTWRALSPEMKHVANRRMALEAAEIDVDDSGAKSQAHGLKLALLDVKVYIFALFNLCITAGIGMQNFFPTMTATLGHGRIMSLVLVAPPYIFMTFWSLSAADRTSHKAGNEYEISHFETAVTQKDLAERRSPIPLSIGWFSP